jgi:hypothetical protein
MEFTAMVRNGEIHTKYPNPDEPEQIATLVLNH